MHAVAGNVLLIFASSFSSSLLEPPGHAGTRLCTTRVPFRPGSPSQPLGPVHLCLVEEVASLLSGAWTRLVGACAQHEDGRWGAPFLESNPAYMYLESRLYSSPEQCNTRTHSCRHSASQNRRQQRLPDTQHEQMPTQCPPAERQPLFKQPNRIARTLPSSQSQGPPVPARHAWERRHVTVHNSQRRAGVWAMGVRSTLSIPGTELCSLRT